MFVATAGLTDPVPVPSPAGPVGPIIPIGPVGPVGPVGEMMVSVGVMNDKFVLCIANPVQCMLLNVPLVQYDYNIRFFVHVSKISPACCSEMQPCDGSDGSDGFFPADMMHDDGQSASGSIPSAQSRHWSRPRASILRSQ